MIWQTEPPFSVGANLQKATARLKSERAAFRLQRPGKKIQENGAVCGTEGGAQAQSRRCADGGKLAEVEAMVEQFQQTSQDLDTR